MSRRDENGPDQVDLRLLKAAVEAAGEAILITSADLDEPGPSILYANPAFTRLSGYATHEVTGRSPRFLQGSGTDRATLDRTRAALSAGEAFQGETLNYRKDGSAYWVEWLITPVKNADGHITHWVSAQRDVTERRAYEDRQALMVRELHHRVKNTLATVQAVLNATVRSSLTMPEFTRAFTGRIVSLARTHALITEDQGQVASFEGLLRAELDPYNENGRIMLRGPRVRLPSELAVPVSMALHELTTNALRHGALAHPDGRVSVTWTVEEGETRPCLSWTWDEHDGPPPTLPTREGFGSRLLNKILVAQTAAQVDVAFDADGLRVNVRVPLEHV
ncbi:PAS domain S-box-containing protein [Methylobacterium sp. PvP062]|uniref:Blue-light-activated histidine kinase n=2 Tax=Methylobacterium TaxID=407 RepID=A0A509EBL6_9HYPH|nr:MULTISPECIES: HWE histidine kinase domain-containing protein [Methylobacterium]MBN6818464.1 PAS domain-containing protein [Methylobacterium organophilum]MCX7333295.1 PAS domain-containing protein [Hyphomicrobiales bacterium]MWV21455.1 PAS domain-containing protein [Methylobacterium sp. 2A]GAN46019.1 signal transduction histidine kinase [Methylobacterium sp. ME121]MBP2492885.1 PAS domain S-box-containing protein [Methylobacterium sp. PvP105]